MEMWKRKPIKVRNSCSELTTMSTKTLLDFYLLFCKNRLLAFLSKGNGLLCLKSIEAL